MKKEKNEQLLRKIEGLSLFKIGDRVKFKSKKSKNAVFFTKKNSNYTENNKLIVMNIVDLKKSDYLINSEDFYGTKAKYGYRVGDINTFNVMEEELKLDGSKVFCECGKMVKNEDYDEKAGMCNKCKEKF